MFFLLPVSVHFPSTHSAHWGTFAECCPVLDTTEERVMSKLNAQGPAFQGPPFFWKRQTGSQSVNVIIADSSKTGKCCSAELPGHVPRTDYRCVRDGAPRGFAHPSCPVLSSASAMTGAKLGSRECWGSLPDARTSEWSLARGPMCGRAGKSNPGAGARGLQAVK